MRSSYTATAASRRPSSANVKPFPASADATCSREARSLLAPKPCDYLVVAEKFIFGPLRHHRTISRTFPTDVCGQRDNSRRRSHAAKGTYANRTYSPSAKKIPPKKTPYLGRDRTAIRMPNSGDDAK
jgi:hypothetical protein